jgi:hypothetical protein
MPGFWHTLFNFNPTLHSFTPALIQSLAILFLHEQEEGDDGVLGTTSTTTPSRFYSHHRTLALVV